MAYVEVEKGVQIYYEELGKGDRVILSAQIGFYHNCMHQKLAEMGYHVYCITLRGFAPSSYVYEDYGERWYDMFAADVIKVADSLGIERFIYMGASHGAGVGWHIMLEYQSRIDAFVAVVPGPHSLAEGTMSYRQMIEQGIIEKVPPFNPPIDNDEARELRRRRREEHISKAPAAAPEERRIDYGRPLMRLKSEERLCEELKKIEVPVIIIGGMEDPISTPELMLRSAACLPHCKLVIYSNCGHDIDTDLIEEACEEADRFISNVMSTEKAYAKVEEC